MPFERGFKAQCERRSLDLRKALGLGSTDPLLADDSLDWRRPPVGARCSAGND